MKEIKEKQTLLKLLDESISDLIFLHKIQETLLEEVTKKIKVYSKFKEVVLGLSGLLSVFFIYIDEVKIAFLVSFISCLTVILDNIFRFSSVDKKYENIKSNVSELWSIKKEIQYQKEYLSTDMINWKDAKTTLDNSLNKRKKLYAKLDVPSKRVVNVASLKLFNKSQNDINKIISLDNQD